MSTKQGASQDPLLSSNPQRDLFDRHASKYMEEVHKAVSFAGKNPIFFIDAKLRLLRDLAKSCIANRTEIRLLDVGCGTGLLHPGLQKLGFSVHGADVSAEALRAARSTNPEATYTVMGGSALPYGNNIFDITIAVCVLHHTDEEQRRLLVSEMCRVTRGGGLVAVVDHNPFNPLTRLAVWRCAFDSDAELLTASQARRLFRAADIHPLTRHFLFFPFRHRFFSWVEKHVGWLGLGAQYCVYGRCR